MAFHLQLPLSGGADALEDACVPKGEAYFRIITSLRDSEFEVRLDWRLDGGFFFFW